MIIAIVPVPYLPCDFLFWNLPVSNDLANAFVFQYPGQNVIFPKFNPWDEILCELGAAMNDRREYKFQ